MLMHFQEPVLLIYFETVFSSRYETETCHIMLFADKMLKELLDVQYISQIMATSKPKTKQRMALGCCVYDSKLPRVVLFGCWTSWVYTNKHI